MDRVKTASDLRKLAERINDIAFMMSLADTEDRERLSDCLYNAEVARSKLCAIIDELRFQTGA